MLYRHISKAVLIKKDCKTEDWNVRKRQLRSRTYGRKKRRSKGTKTGETVRWTHL